MIVTTEHAKALYMLSEEDGISDSILSSVKSIKQLLNDNPDYIKLLDSPAVDISERLTLLDSAFGEVETILLSFIKILTEKRSMCCFSRCADDYIKIYEEDRGIETAIAVTTQPLTASQSDALKTKLEGITGKTVVIKNEIDPNLIGGITLRFSGMQYDSSIKARLESLKNSLCKIIV